MSPGDHGVPPAVEGERERLAELRRPEDGLRIEPAALVELLSELAEEAAEGTAEVGQLCRALSAASDMLEALLRPAPAPAAEPETCEQCGHEASLHTMTPQGGCWIHGCSCRSSARFVAPEAPAPAGEDVELPAVLQYWTPQQLHGEVMRLRAELEAAQQYGRELAMECDDLRAELELRCRERDEADEKLREIHALADGKLSRFGQRRDSKGHVCDYRAALQSVRDRTVPWREAT